MTDQNMNSPKPAAYEIWQKPPAEDVVMLTGFRQWADAGAVSSGLPQYLVHVSGAQPIGRIKPDGFYLFQVPGTHDLMRPIVKFSEGYPVALETQHNDFYYTGDSQHGVVIFMGDEPHLDVERYVNTLLDAARALNVKRIVSFGGVYGELPYDKERMISATYSLPSMKDDLQSLAVIYSDYQGGASIDSVVTRRAGEQGMPCLGLYAFVPAYDFSMVSQTNNSIRIENDYGAWLALLRRVNFYLHLNFDLVDLESKSRHLVEVVNAKLTALDEAAPQLGVLEYVNKLSRDYHEVLFNPLDPLWDEELKKLLDKLDDQEPPDHV
jgi:proteasome assembly chaperone (PAC2) family protein